MVTSLSSFKGTAADGLCLCHAYLAGRSVDTALHQLVTRLEMTISAGDLAKGVFIDIDSVRQRIVRIHGQKGLRERE